MAAGAATFERLTLTGGVGRTIPLALSCTPRGPALAPPAGGLLPAGATPLPALPLTIPVAICPRGKEPPPAGAAFGVCAACPFGRFSFGGGGACVPCPSGGLCPGGAAGEATPVKAYAGYWRSTNESAVPLFPCPVRKKREMGVLGGRKGTHNKRAGGRCRGHLPHTDPAPFLTASTTTTTTPVFSSRFSPDRGRLHGCLRSPPGVGGRHGGRRRVHAGDEGAPVRPVRPGLVQIRREVQVRRERGERLGEGAEGERAAEREEREERWPPPARSPCSFFSLSLFPSPYPLFRPCSGIGAGKAMVAAAAAVLLAFLAAIFARTWGGTDAGPGPMTKVKLATTHVQLLALLRDFDVAWPATTLQALGWADALNVGVSLTAPECLVKGWSFWHYYTSSQALPAAAVALCAGVYLGAGAVVASARRKAKAAAGGALPTDTEEGNQGSPPPPSPLPRAARLAAAVQERCWRNAFWLVTLLYPRAAQAALQLFSLTRLNTGTFLGADLGVLVRPVVGPDGACPGEAALTAAGVCPLTRTFKMMVPVGAAILAVVALGVPAFFFGALWRSRKRLGERDVLVRYSFLYCGEGVEREGVGAGKRKKEERLTRACARASGGRNLSPPFFSLSLTRAHTPLPIPLSPFSHKKDTAWSTGSRSTWCASWPSPPSPSSSPLNPAARCKPWRARPSWSAPRSSAWRCGRTRRRRITGCWWGRRLVRS